MAPSFGNTREVDEQRMVGMIEILEKDMQVLGSFYCITICNYSCYQVRKCICVIQHNHKRK